MFLGSLKLLFQFELVIVLSRGQKTSVISALDMLLVYKFLSHFYFIEKGRRYC